MSQNQGAEGSTRERIRRGIAHYVPIVSWGPRYDRQNLQGDLISGLTLGAVVVPVAMAYAQMAGLEPQSGLYTALAALVAYAVFGTSRHIRVTATSTMAVMSAAVVAPMAGGDAATVAALSAALALVVGVILTLAGIAHLGFISDFLSKSVVTGFVFGLAITVVIGQLPKLFGVPAGSGNSIQQLIQLIQNLDETNPWSLALGLGALAAIILIKQWRPRVPGPLLVLAAGILLVVIFDLGDKGVSVVGAIPTGMPQLQFPNAGPGNWLILITGAVGIVFLAVGESLGSARAYAAVNRTEIDADQELLALGASNISASLMQGMTVDVSLSQTATANAAGARTQLSSLVTAGVLLVTILFLAPLFYNLPNSALSAIVIASVVPLMDVEELRRFYHSRQTDFWLAMFALIGVVWTDVLTGLVFAVILSLGALLYRASRPYIATLGQDLNDPGSFGDIKRHRRYVQVPGLLMLRVDAPLYFFNANVARQQVVSAVEAEHPSAVLLDIGASADLDIATSDMLQELAESLRTQGTDLYLAQVRGSVKDRLRRTAAMGALGEDHVVHSVSLGIAAFRAREMSRAEEIAASSVTLVEVAASVEPPEVTETGSEEGASAGPLEDAGDAVV